ncbi:TetR/AcrR family transcriptional regulator [Neptunicoccus cionae]|uniref:TetR/AcrR family transcriptional regulator n=1 Tax=Neptunicoccus cionae TaxID=2035344 RepID=UPI000C77F714|nr:TetR/AcrR family transcriptional regulator [Amylibacter cionae]PLS20021.1 TetR/AcrR family transcriptional regulator [Amylibacter cionae]
METAKQKERRVRIEKAAYDVLEKKGYKGASMLDIARQAGCSNETLYRWYGNKQALFASLVAANAAAVKTQLEKSIQEDGDTIEELRLLGPQLLELVTSRRAIALNRAAAGDVYHTGTLGEAIAREGKNTVAPLVERLVRVGLDRKLLHRGNSDEIAGLFLMVLIGDTQIQRVIGVIPELTEAQKEDRTDRACAVIQKLYGA